MNATESKTVLGRAVKFHGELSGTGDLLVEGEFEGIIRLTGSRVTIGPDAVVHAHVAAQEIIVYGKLKGEIRATGLLSLLDSAVVEGTVLAGRLAMEEGTSLRGSVDPTRAGESLPPFPSKAIAPTPAQQIAQSPLQLVAERYPAEVQKPKDLLAAHTHVADDHDSPQFDHMPAGLAAAARRVDASLPTSDSEPSSALAGTEA